MSGLYNRLIRMGITAGLLFSITISNVCVMPRTMQAKKKVKRLTMMAGDKKKIYLSRSAKKVVYKSSDKKIATVSKKGIVTAKKKGKCTVIVTVNRRKYRYLLTVKKKKRYSADDRFSNICEPSAPAYLLQPDQTNRNPAVTPSATDMVNEKVLADNIAVNSSILQSGKRLYAVTNNNQIQIDSVRLDIMYYNENGTPIKSGEAVLEYLEPSEKRYIVIAANVKGADYLNTAVSVRCYYSKYGGKSRANVSVSARRNPEDGTVIATIVNQEMGKCSFRCVCLFKDYSGNILDAREISMDLNGNETRCENIMAPYIITSYEPIEYTEYELVYYAMRDR